MEATDPDQSFNQGGPESNPIYDVPLAVRLSLTHGQTYTYIASYRIGVDVVGCQENKHNSDSQTGGWLDVQRPPGNYREHLHYGDIYVCED